MKKKYLFLLLGVGMILGAASYKRSECTNTNPVFDAYAPETPEYRNELARQLRSLDPSDLNYWFDSYSELGGKEYINIRINGTGMCAIAQIAVSDWAKLEGIRRTKGMGYVGARLKGLVFDISDAPSGALFNYRDLQRIVD
ncbi:MAG: hypothetical protein HUU01_08125 [Saprospiraceae bacterium]|nr:hypothetical protein [Saprospiraceae bacterium]